ncbi:amino acid permease-domain-containing protein [Geopyxis carbonaria]|nr:amino acid permease-domain-containing protein [Geopyxis carbonaria]
MDQSHITYSAPVRDSLELASLADSSEQDVGSPRSSLSSSDGISSSRRLSLSSDVTDTEAGPGRPRKYRSYSVTSAFDFNAHLVPLTSSAETQYQPIGAPSSSNTPNPVGGLEKQKTLSYLNGLSLLIGLIIGSGIFAAPSQVNNHVPSPGIALIIWTIAGLLAWTGAASYAELGGAIPLNGGSGVYLRHCFGDLSSFLFSWTAVIVLKPGGAAIIAIISGEYFNRVIFGSFRDADAPLPGSWTIKVTAIICFSAVTLVAIISTKLTTRISNVMMFLKVGTLLAITIIGIIVAATGLNGDGKGASKEWRDTNWFAPRPDGVGGRAPTSEDDAGGLGEYAIALYAGLWAFDGWDNVNYVTGEMRHPERDLPRVIHTGMPIVIASYLLANMAYYFVLPGSTIGSSNTVAVAFGSKVFGPVGGLLLAIAVSLSCLGALNASTFTSGRLVYVAGKEGYIPRVFGTLGLGPNTRFARSTPVYANLLNAALTIAYILVGSFDTLLTFYGVAGYTFYFLTVLGLIVLRFREPDLHRPYRTWISTPVIFCCVSLFLVSRSVFSSPGSTAVVCAFVACGVPVWAWRVRGIRWGFWRKKKGMAELAGDDDTELRWEAPR